MRETWRVLIDGSADGPTNMAYDEALLDACAAGEAGPTLRLYRWRPACLSLGRFQRSADIDSERCAATGVDMVRRPSGGRALLHDDEATYALVAPADHPLVGGTSLIGSYRRISAALLAGLRLLGVPAEAAPARSERNALPASAACFSTPASYELLVGGRKLVGSAQARRDTALLQHGAIPLAPHADRLAALLGTPAAPIRMTTLGEVLGEPISFEAVAEALIAGVASTFGILLVPGVWSASEHQRAALLRPRYLDPTWTFGR